MTFSQRSYQWNVWYDSLPREWRFQLILWPLIVLGTINMLLTVSTHFPFGLLLLMGVLFVAAVRVPYKICAARFGTDGVLPSTVPDRAPIQISGMEWAVDWNRRYDALPELRRLYVFPAILVVAGLINMLLTISSGFPFGLIFLLAIVAVVAIRVPYVRGWLKSSDPVAAADPDGEISHEPVTAAIAASAGPAAIVAAEPTVAGAEFPVPVLEHPDEAPHPAVAAPPTVSPVETPVDATDGGTSQGWRAE